MYERICPAIFLLSLVKFYPREKHVVPCRTNVERMLNESLGPTFGRDEDDRGFLSKRNLCHEFVSTWISEIKIY